MDNIIILTNYNNQFGSKQITTPYRNGMDIEVIKKRLLKYNITSEVLNFSDITFRERDYTNQTIIYTSSEDIDYLYKDYIEDVILGLSLNGAKLIPDFNFLRANNNKVFMEIMRDQFTNSIFHNITSHHFGTLEDLKRSINELPKKNVLKTAKGAMSRGVELGKSHADTISKGSKISRSRYWFNELWNLKNKIKHKGFNTISKYRKKFITQNFIPNLKNDWKVVIFGDKYFVVERGIKNNDFRASGSGLFSFPKKLPNGLLDFAREIAVELNLPHLSIDIAYDQSEFYLIEFQALYFGTKAVEFNDFHFEKRENKWTLINKKHILEHLYVDSLLNHLLK